MRMDVNMDECVWGHMYTFVGGHACQSLAVGLNGERRNRILGCSERKKAELWLAVRHKTLNYTVQTSQE